MRFGISLAGEARFGESSASWSTSSRFRPAHHSRFLSAPTSSSETLGRHPSNSFWLRFRHGRDLTKPTASPGAGRRRRIAPSPSPDTATKTIESRCLYRAVLLGAADTLHVSEQKDLNGNGGSLLACKWMLDHDARDTLLANPQAVQHTEVATVAGRCPRTAVELDASGVTGTAAGELCGKSRSLYKRAGSKACGRQLDGSPAFDGLPCHRTHGPSCDNGSRTDADQYPKIVVILSDDLGLGSLLLRGRRAAHSNANPRPPSQGRATFHTDANSTSSVCTPTRYGLLTGRYSWRTSLRHGVLGITSPLHIETSQPTISSLLSSALAGGISDIVKSPDRCSGRRLAHHPRPGLEIPGVPGSRVTGTESTPGRRSHLRRMESRSTSTCRRTW